MRLLRWHYRRAQRGLDVEKLWFFDESGVNLSMTRAYARGPKGQRVVGYVPKNWGESETLMAGIGVRGVLAPMLLHGSLTSAVFEHYLAEFVAPISVPATCWCSTISAHIAPTRLGRSSPNAAHICFSCRLIRRTSTPSSWLGRRSRRSREEPPRERSMISSRPSRGV